MPAENSQQQDGVRLPSGRFRPGASGNPGRRFRPGASGNPGGRPKVVEDIRALAREHSPAALQTLRHIADKGKQESARVAAAVALLDRAYGKPTQPIAGDDDMPPVGISGTAV